MQPLTLQLAANPTCSSLIQRSTFSNAMKLIVVALSAWSATSLASAGSMYEVVDSNTWNATYTGSTADRESSEYTDNFEERVREVPAKITSILENLHAPIIQNLPAYQREAKKAELTLRIQDLDNTFSGLILATNHDNIFEGDFFLEWTKKVRKIYKDLPEVADTAMFEMLVHHFPDDHALSALLAGTKIDKTKDIATKLLDVQVKVWVREGRDAAEVFELLQLHQTKDKLFQSPLFSKWVAFAESRYPDSPEAATEAMFSVLAGYGKDDDLAKFLAAKTKTDSTEGIATKLLDVQVKVWVREGRDAAEVFELLQLHQTKDKLFQSPLFSKWVAFVESLYPTKLPLAHRVMFTTLRKYYKGDKLPDMLVARIRIEGMEGIAEKLLDLQLTQWKSRIVSEGAEVWNILMRNIEGKPWESLLYPKWETFVKRKYKNPAEAKRVIAKRLQKEMHEFHR